jgi:membrane carboxypeptidase/penicillin-binding protein
MKISSYWASVLVLVGLVAGASTVCALNTPRVLHRPKAEQKLSQTHSTSSRHAATKSAPPARSTARSESRSTARAAAPAAHTSAKSPKSGKALRQRGAATVKVSAHSRRHRFNERFTASSFASDDQTAADQTAGEDPIVRQAAVAALGDMNGTAVVINPANGRILAMVNQKLALSPGAEPCSTIKLTVALAALSEGLVTADTPVKLDGFRMNMTQAIAKSNNLYFEELGRELGFERLHRYENQFGLGELAGYKIQGEQLGTYPDQELPAAEGGVGRMCSFGQGVSLTPLQLGAFVAALANGGTLYYLQHPTSQEELASFEPRVKRKLEIAQYVPQMLDGMAGAVEFGTARRLRANFQELPIFGKTGTCSDKGTRFGWFASYSNSPMGSLVTVFFLEGGRPTFGPRAAELTGVFYKNLWEHDYFKPLEADAKAPAAVAAAAQPVTGQ